jgi:hypothetical protein
MLFSALQRHRAWDIRSENRHVETDRVCVRCLQMEGDEGKIEVVTILSCYNNDNLSIFTKERHIL